MKDLLGLMGKAKEMQAKFQAMQDEITGLETSLASVAVPANASMPRTAVPMPAKR